MLPHDYGGQNYSNWISHMAQPVPVYRGGISHIWGFPKNGQNRPKLAKIHISPKVVYIETTLGGSQNNLKEHLDTVFKLRRKNFKLIILCGVNGLVVHMTLHCGYQDMVNSLRKLGN